MTNSSLHDRYQHIKLVITDVDGVLTDGGMYYNEKGEALKKYNVRDGAGVALLKAMNLRVGIITGEKTQSAVRRAEKIGMDFVRCGVVDKLRCLKIVLKETGLDRTSVAYIGDEINDAPLLNYVGLFFTVSDANPLIRERADVVLGCRGGEGALRELAQMLLGERNELEVALKRYLANHHAPNIDPTQK